MKVLMAKSYFPYLIAASGIATMTAVKIALRSQINSTTVALIFLLFIFFLATAFGSKPALLASFLAGICFNFFFLPPIGTLSIADPENWIALLAFLIVAITAGQLSAKVKNRAEEAERLYAELQNAFEQASMAEALRRSEKLKSSLLDAVTHNLRTPLTSIKASVTTLIENEKEKFLDDEGKIELLEIINEETDRLNEFIAGMVGIAKIEADELHLRKSQSEIDEIINNSLVRAKNHLQKHQILLDVEPDLPSIFVDANSISEVIFILLDNAAKYSKENSKIRVSAFRATNEMIRIAVEDQGRGIPKEIREKVFDKFFRASEDAIHTTESGLGLGLAIAKGIIESQGGQIWIEDGNKEFTTKFVFQIPIGNE
jgi:two-component system sensor histidine kinase KdpD